MADFAGIFERVVDVRSGGRRDSQATTKPMAATTGLPPRHLAQIASPADDARWDHKARARDRNVLGRLQCRPYTTMSLPLDDARS